MRRDPCPCCGWIHPPSQRKRPASYANNTTPIEIQIEGVWRRFDSVAQAATVTGFHRATIFRNLKHGERASVRVRLAKKVEAAHDR